MYSNSLDDQEIREKNRKIIERYFEVPHGCEEQTTMYAPDCVWEQPFYRPGEVGPIFPSADEMPPEIPEGFEFPEFTPEWEWLPGTTKIYATDDPNYFFAENAGRGMQLIGDNTLQPYENYYFHTFELKDGKIVHYREIANPCSLMKTMKCKFEPLPRPEETLQKLINIYKKEHSIH